MRVRRLDTLHDVTFGRGLGNFSDKAESVAQRVKTRLFLLENEWFLDTDAGMPYIQRISGKPADVAYAQAVIKQRILETDGVLSISNWSASLDHNTRRFVVTCTVSSIYGSTENIKVSV